MKNTRFALLLVAACALMLPTLSPADTVVEEIIARVNNEIVTRSEYVRSRDQLKQEVQQQDAANADHADHLVAADIFVIEAGARVCQVQLVARKCVVGQADVGCGVGVVDFVGSRRADRQRRRCDAGGGG